MIVAGVILSVGKYRPQPPPAPAQQHRGAATAEAAVKHQSKAAVAKHSSSKA